MSAIELLGKKTKISVRAIPDRIRIHSARVPSIRTLELKIEEIDGGAVYASLSLPELAAGYRHITRWPSMEIAQREYDLIVDKLQRGRYNIQVYSPDIFTVTMLD